MPELTDAQRHAIAQRHAVALAHRKRRDSHRGYPGLHQTHGVALGGSLSSASFPEPHLPVTMKLRVDFSGSTPEGEIVSWNGGSIGFDVGRLEVITGGSIYRVTVFGNPTSHSDIVVAIRPNDGQVRAWVDSRCVLSATTTQSGHNWIGAGTLSFQSITDATVLAQLEIYDKALPRHFNACPATPGLDPGGTFCTVLYRAAHATGLATSKVPYVGIV